MFESDQMWIHFSRARRLMLCVAVVVLLPSLGLTQVTPTDQVPGPQKLRCEYLEDPLGIDTPNPRLSWIIPLGARGQRQTAYRIIVSKSLESLNRDEADLWDSGRIESDQSIHVPYNGTLLKSWMRCYWKVRFWNGDGAESAWSTPAFWTMGLLAKSDWQGQWIGLDTDERETNRSEHTRLPARMLRKEFEVDPEMKSATAAICGLGLFELHLNGVKVSDHVMDPALTDYAQRTLYVTFDVTDHIRTGRNALGVILGNGRFFAPRRTKAWSSIRQYGYPKMILHMRMEYEDGTIRNVVSDSSWKMTTQGPILANNEYDGEEYDARLEQADWCQPGFDDSTWQAAQLVEAPGAVLQSQMVQPMRITEIIHPVEITNLGPDTYLLDMGQAFYGMVRLKVSGPAGTRVQLRSAYSLMPDGMLKTADNRSAQSTDVYVLRGNGEEHWCPRFRGQGFRRVEVTGFPSTPTLDSVEGLVVHTDMPETGFFKCSDPLINQIHRNIRWTQRMYHRGLPMDPDRDERLGWLGDPAGQVQSNAFNFSVAALYSKWLGDVRLDQQEDGRLPDVSPGYFAVDTGDIVWPSVITMVPNSLYEMYGDHRVLEDNYPCLKRWMTYIRRHLKPDFTADQCQYGDWCDTYSMDGKGGLSGKTSKPLIATAYYYHNCRLTERIARALHHKEDEKHFAELAHKIKSGFNARFFDTRTGTYQGNTQCAYVLALAFELVPDTHKERVVSNLIADIVNRNDGHLTVGLIGMQWLMQLLTDIGQPEVAYRLATRTTRPSWGYMVSKGATTIWERWDSDTQPPGMNSEALLMLAGNLNAWLYQTIAGINHDPSHPGFKHFILRPRLLGNLEYARASYECMYGAIESDWTIKDGMFTWRVTVPPNTTATVYVPAASIDVVREGNQPAVKARGVSFLGMQDETAVFTVTSGRYNFAAEH